MSKHAYTSIGKAFILSVVLTSAPAIAPVVGDVDNLGFWERRRVGVILARILSQVPKAAPLRGRGYLALRGRGYLAFRGRGIGPRGRGLI
jgi:hypothetical protein